MKAERDALQKKNAELTAPKKKREPPPPKSAPPKSERPKAGDGSGWTGWIIGGVVGTAFAAFMGYTIWRDHKLRADYERDRAEYDALHARWSPLVHLEPCVRARDVADISPRTAPAKWTEQTASFRASSYRSCADYTKKLVGDDGIPESTRGPLRAWLAADADLTAASKHFDDYLEHKDWMEDHFGAAPSLWKGVTDARGHELVPRHAVPATFAALRELIRGYQSREEQAKGKDDAWWRIELGLERWELAEVGLNASGIREGKRFDVEAFADAVRVPASAWVRHWADAPLEVRRALRDETWAVNLGTATSGQIFQSLMEEYSSLFDGISEPPGMPKEPSPPDDG